MTMTTNAFIHINEIHPPLGASTTLYMLEPFSVMIKISNLNQKENKLIAQIWTNSIDKVSPEGQWHALPMQQISLSPSSCTFQGNIFPTAQGFFEYTFRIGNSEDKGQDSREWFWAGSFQYNGSIKVLPPSSDMKWTQGPQVVEIADNVYVGNYIAASKASELGFQAVLNMAEELNLSFLNNTNDLQYIKIGLHDGAHNPIPPEKIVKAISWIKENVKKDYKVCINCRAGIGRSGSIGIAYLYASNKNWAYEKALEAAWIKKPDIYPHSQLKQTLEDLFPRVG